MRCRVARIATAAAFVSLVVVTANVEPAPAHTPHDQVSDVAVSPAFATDRTVFTISDSRPMRSTDGGRHWAEMARGLTGQNFQQFAGSASDPSVVYLSALNSFNLGENRSGPSVFRSDDQGVTWRPTNTGMGMVNVTRLAVSSSSSDVVLAAGGLFGALYRSIDGGDSWAPVPGVRSVKGITFVPGQKRRAVIVDGTGSIHVSDDDGATFKTTERSDESRAFTSVAVGNKAAGSVLFAGTDDGSALRSDDAGDTWTVAASHLPGRQLIRSFALSDDYELDHTVWASTLHHGVYRSTDAGRTWKTTSGGLTHDHQADTFKLPQFGDLASTSDETGRQLLFLAGYDGLFESSNGTDWESIETLADYVTGLAVSPSYARDGTVVVSTYVKGLYVSRDRGRSFTPSNHGLLRALDAGNKLLPVRRMHNVVFSPDYASDATIFTATWTRFVMSTDRGKSWRSVSVAPSPPGTSLRQFVIAVSPDFAADGTVFLGTRQGDVYRSTKRGTKKSWSATAKLPGRVRSIVVSPAFATDHTLFAGSAGGTFVSHDAGTTWSASGPEGISLLAISPGFASDGTVFAGTERGLTVSRDHGATWSEVDAGPLSPTSGIAAIAVSPSFETDRTVLVSVAGEGLVRSTDAGMTFRATGSSLLDHGVVVTDFENPTSEPIQFSPTFARDGTVFAYGQQSVVRSTDGGETWKTLNLPPAAKFEELDTTSGSASDDGGNALLPIALAVLGAGVVLGGIGLVVSRRRSAS